MGAFGVTEKPAERDELVGSSRSLREEAGREAAQGAQSRQGAPEMRGVPELAGAKVLIVDDDIRNIFSLTSVLESHDVEVLHAERGKDGILILEQTPGVDVALIDIMMPEMDGYETMQQIRRAPGACRPAADRRHRQGDEGRPPEVPRCRRIGLYRQAGRHRAAARAAARVGGAFARSHGSGREPHAAGGRGVRHEPAQSERFQCKPRVRDERSEDRTGAERPRVLLVDDDERNLLAIATVLEDLGDVVLARSGEEALRHLLKGEFAVILLDVYMPGMDGYETAQIIRSRDQTKGIPIVFLSAVNKEAEHLLRGYSMGAVDYVFKPVDPIILRSKVAVFVDLFAKTKEVERKARQEQALLDEPSRQRRAPSGGAGAAPRRAAAGGDHPVAADGALSRAL